MLGVASSSSGRSARRWRSRPAPPWPGCSPRPSVAARSGRERCPGRQRPQIERLGAAAHGEAARAGACRRAHARRPAPAPGRPAPGSRPATCRARGSERFQAARGVDRVAQDRELDPPLVADVAQHHRPEMQADPGAAAAARRAPPARRSNAPAPSASPGAQASALAASCGPGRGVPKVAITLSPMNLSSVPPCANTQSAMRPWKPRSMAMTASGAMRSHRPVKPTMSTNRTATSWVRTGRTARRPRPGPRPGWPRRGGRDWRGRARAGPARRPAAACGRPRRRGCRRSGRR